MNMHSKEFGLKSIKKLIFLVLILAIVSCTSEPNPSSRIKGFDYPKRPKTKMSTINLPISIPLKEVEALVNSKVGNVLIEKKGIDTDKILIENLKVYRSENVNLKTKGNKLLWEVPLNFKIKASPKQKALQLNFLKHLEIGFGLNFFLESKVELQKDYHLITTTTLKSYSWEEEPELNFGKIHISLTKALAKQIEENKAELIGKLDSLIHQKVNLSESVAKIWNNLQSPKSIHKQHEIFWLNILPKNISASQPKFKNNQIIIPLGLYLKMDLQVTDSLPKNELLPLPNINIVKSNPENFEINVLAKIPYQKLNQNWKLFLPNNTVKIKGEVLNIDNLKFMGLGDKIGIEVQTSGLTQSTVLFSGKPQIGKNDWVLTIIDFDYEMTNSDLLADGAEMLYSDEFKKLVNAMLYFPLKPQLMILPTVLENALNKGDKIEQRKISITKIDYVLNHPQVNKDTLYLDIKALGNAGVLVQSLNKP